MLTHCPHCKQQLNFSKDQLGQLRQALAQLAPGKALQLKCPYCQQVIKLEKPATPQGAVIAEPPGRPAAQSVRQGPLPPPPPTLDWLHNGAFQDGDKVEDVPMAMIVHGTNEQNNALSTTLARLGYQVVASQSADDALERMQFVSFACIVLFVDAAGGVNQSPFHAYMAHLGMETRRGIIYVLVGSSLHTMYDIEAFASSANLTISTQDFGHIDVILRRAIHDYEDLFGPLMEAFAEGGKG